MQAEEFQHSIRPGLVIMLPRLMRFADLLVGAREEGTALLRRALQRMLAEEYRYQRGVARVLDALADDAARSVADRILRRRPSLATLRVFHNLGLATQHTALAVVLVLVTLAT